MPATLCVEVRGFAALANMTAQVGPVFTLNRGFVSPPVRNGAGDYTLTLQEGITLNEAQPEVQPLSALFVSASVELVTPTTLRVRTFDAAGAALESNFAIRVLNVGPS